MRDGNLKLLTTIESVKEIYERLVKYFEDKKISELLIAGLREIPLNKDIVYNQSFIYGKYLQKGAFWGKI